MSKERITEITQRIKMAMEVLDKYIHDPHSFSACYALDWVHGEFCQTEPSSDDPLEVRRAEYNRQYQAVVSMRDVPTVDVFEAYIRRQEQELELLREQLPKGTA